MPTRGLHPVQAKKNRPEGRFSNQREPIILQHQQQPKQRPRQRSKLQQQRQQRSKRQPKQQQQRQQQQLEQQRQQQELRRLRQQQLVRSQLLVLVQEQLLLSCCKQPERQPSGKRSAGIFSWIFLF
jgi:folylpolyglutamate synthase/dihydropteroate synthase